LDTLDPPGEVKSPLVNIKHGEPDPSMERLIESWKSPEARGEYAADFIFQSLRKIPNLSPQEREARRQYLNKLGVPSLLREFYGMSEAATDLIPKKYSGETILVEVPAGFQRLYVVRDRCDSGIHRRQA